jgi:hypothetical protein
MHFWCRDFVTSCGIESLQGKYLNGNRMSRIFAVAWQRRIYLGKGRSTVQSDRLAIRLDGTRLYRAEKAYQNPKKH